MNDRNPPKEDARSVELIDQIERQIEEFESHCVQFKDERFEPELRLSRQILGRLRSGNFSFSGVVDDINSLDDHYNGIGWSGFVHMVAEYLNLCGEDCDAETWFDSEWRPIPVILPKVKSLELKDPAPAELLERLHQVILPQFKRLSDGHQRFEQAYLAAKEIVEGLGRGVDLSLQSEGSATCVRLGGPHSWCRELLDCASAYLADRLGTDREGRCKL